MTGRGWARMAMAALLLLPGCASYSLQKLRQTPPTGTPFQTALSRLYMDFAESEEKQYDWSDSWHFADKGLMLAYGHDMPPETPAAWDVPEEILPVMEEAHKSLLAILTPEVKQSRPEEAARAQFYFDCWVEQQEENWQIEDIVHCRDNLHTALVALGAPYVNLSLAQTDMEVQSALSRLDALAQPVPEGLREEPAAVSAASEVKPAPVPVDPKPILPSTSLEPETVSYVVFFDYNTAELSASGRKVVDEAAAAVAGMTDYEVVINGYTDTSGSAEYNLKLSNRRAESVRQALVGKGVREHAIRTFAYGKSDPRFRTGDGIKEAANRRVEIFLNE